jgi:hypothetical protein
VEPQKFSIIADGNSKWSKLSLEDSLMVSYKAKHPLICSPATTDFFLPKGVENLCLHKNLHIDIYSILIHNYENLKQPSCPSRDEQINKLWYIQTMEYYLVLKRNKLPNYGKT